MKAERLIELFERVGEAPGAVTKLRALVLDLALRGRLVLQDPADEPIAKTLREINLRRAAKAGGASTASQPDVDEEGVNRLPHAVPVSWQCVALGQVSEIFMGQSPPGHSYNKRGEGLPLINGPVEFSAGPFGRTVINQFTTEPTVLCDEGDLLVCVRGSTTGRTNVASCHACIGRGVAAIRPYMPDRYLRLVIWRLRDAIIGMGRGIAFPSVSRAQLQALPVPLPPLAEQQRIAARVAELMALCDQLESAQAERERRRDRLVSASLQRLREPVEDGAVLREQAAFHLRHMGRMTTRVEHVRELREAVLAMAVRGGLDGQRPIAQDSVRLGDVATLQNGYAFKSEWFASRGVRLLRNINVTPHGVRWEEVACLDNERANDFERFALKEGDIVLSLDRPFIVAGTKVARIGPSDGRCLLLQRVGRFVLDRDRLEDDFLFLWLTSKTFSSQLNPGRSNGVLNRAGFAGGSEL